MNATIFDIERNSTVDGPGIRTTVFFKGCNLDCKWCHNPEGKSPKRQMLFYADRCKDCGKCKSVCPNSLTKCNLCGRCEFCCEREARKICGKEYTVDQVFDEIIKDKLFYETSGGGVTFSGGECMLYPDFLLEILKACKNNKIHTAVDTAGNVPWENFIKVMPYTDLFLYDVKCFSNELHMSGTGVSNRVILENLKKLSESFDGDVTVRIPVVVGFNDDGKEMQKIADFLTPLKIKSVELLPYHSLGEKKSLALGQPFNRFSTPSKELIKEYGKILGINKNTKE